MADERRRAARGIDAQISSDCYARALERFPLALISHPSLPGLTRQSIFFVKAFLRRKMDPRVKPAGDVRGYAMPNQMNRKNAPDGVNGSQPWRGF
jgi:hypothetical protein